MQLDTTKPNAYVIVHKDDAGHLDSPVIKLNTNGKEFTYKTAMTYMRKHKLSNDGMKSGWFISTYFRIAHSKWAD